MHKAPNIFQYDDYRQFLKDFFQYKKEVHPQFSYRVFARLAGYTSSSVLKLVMDGKRNLTPDSVERFSNAFKFQNDEAEFFNLLVHFCQSGSLEEKQKTAHHLMASKLSKKISPLAQSKFEYWSKWYNVVIREMAAHPAFQEEPEWIAEHLDPPVGVRDVEKSIQCLLDLGLLTRDAQGKLRQSEMTVATDDKLIQPVIAKFHQTMLEKAKRAISQYDRSNRHISAVTLTLTDDGKRRAQELIANVQKEILALANQNDATARVFQLNFQVFPLTKRFS